MAYGKKGGEIVPATIIEEGHRAHAALLSRLRRDARRKSAFRYLPILEALMIGVVDFRVAPDRGVASEICKKLYSQLYDIGLRSRAAQAAQDWMQCGIGGVAYTPFGCVRIKPESCFPIGRDYSDPDGWVRRFRMTRSDATERFGRAFKKAAGESSPADGASGDGEPYYGVLIDELWDGARFCWYYGDKKIGEAAGRPQWAYFPWIGDPREKVEGLSNDKWLPIGVVEQLTDAEFGSGYRVNLLAAQDKLIYHLMQKAGRGGATAVNAMYLDRRDQNTQTFLEQFAVLMMTDNPKDAMSVIDAVSMTELLACLSKVDEQIVAISGVSTMMQGLLAARADTTATEVMATKNESMIRSTYRTDQAQRWLQRVIECDRFYWMSMPPEHQVDSVVVSIDGTDIAFGLNFPFVNGLSGFSLELTTVGYQQRLQQQQTSEKLATTLVNANAAMMQMGMAPRYDPTPAFDRLIAAHGEDPNRYILQQAPMLPMGADFGGMPNGVGSRSSNPGMMAIDGAEASAPSSALSALSAR